MAITSNFANLATVTRASKAWDSGAWDFISGSAVGQLVEYASGVARTTPSGLLVEGSATNEVRNPRCEGATTGLLSTTGALPTYWATAGLVTTEWTVEGTGTESGWDYIELSYSGSDAAADIYFEATSQIAASTGEDWTTSVCVKLISGSLTNTTMRIRWQDLSGASQLGVENYTIVPDTSLRRFSSTHTTAGGGTQDYVRAGLQFAHSGAAAYRIRIYTPQTEQKAYPTSIVLPTAASPAASTRAADVISVANGAWLAASAHTLFVKFQEGAQGGLAGARVIAQLYYSGSSYIGLQYNSGGGMVGLIRNAGTFTMNISLDAASAGDVLSVAICGDQTSSTVSRSGDAQQTGGAVAPTMTSLNIGTNLNGYIKDLRYFPRRLANAELESLVGN